MEQVTMDLDSTGKIVLNHIYNDPDPRPYFSTLMGLEYMIPGQAESVFRRVIDAHRTQTGQDGVNLLDIGCSYGVNAAILKHGLSMGELYARYAGEAAASLDRDELIAQDQIFYANHMVDADLDITGVDVADNAVSYAVESRMLDGGVAADLETGPVPRSAFDAVAGADLVISTGCIGYVGEPTVVKIVDADDAHSPWMAHFVLRMFPYEPFETLLAERGYVTETLPATFRQRRFASAEERAQVLDNLADLGIDPAGRESEGWYHAEFHLSRPAAAAAAIPLEAMFPS
jgi:hypothetical protein